MYNENIFMSNHTNKPIDKNSGVNVIYFTNQCNLACKYCYEHLDGRPKQIMTKENIRNTIDNILIRENHSSQTLFVLFGGELTLEWNNVLYFMDYAYSKKSNIHFNISSNGIKFYNDKFILAYKNLKYRLMGLTSLDISFDGLGNSERVTKSGKDTTQLMLNIFKKLNYYNIDFRIRYTIHKKNVDVLYDDLFNIANFIKPKRIITSIAWSLLNKKDINNIEITKEKLRQDWIDKRIQIPICEFICDMCSGCSIKKDIKTYFSDEGNITTYKSDEIAATFNDFKK